MPAHSSLTRRTALVAASAFLMTPAILRASTARPARLAMQAPGSGPGILMAQAKAIGAFDTLADDIDLSLWTTPDEMRAGIVSGKVPVTIMPTQGAASLFNKGFGLQMISAVTDGHCGLIARGIPDCTTTDLKGLRVAVPSINGFTGHMMRLALAHYGIALTEVELIPATTKMEGAQVLLAGRADVALLAEPVATAALIKGRADSQDLYRGEQMRDVMGKITGLAPSLPQAALVIRSDMAAAHPDLAQGLSDALKTASASIAADPKAAARNAAPFVKKDAKMLEQAIPFANINARPATAAREQIMALYDALMAADPGLIGGRIPGEALFAV